MNKTDIEKIKALAAQNREEVLAIRHHLHAHPEISFLEKETSAFISKKLKEYGLEHQTNIGGYGIVGLVKGKNPGKKCVALRADMDALPIEEKNDVPYKSVHQGIMHACGHDVHSAALLGALKILCELKDEFEGSVKFIFQPGEEKLPGGASLMIRDGALTNPKPDLILAQHVFTPLPVGTAGFRSGKYMASADEIYITVKGKGGHAAEPKNVINPIFIAAHLLTELEKLMSEIENLESPAILSFGKISGNGATNIIPDKVTIDGTLRTLNENLRLKIHDRLKKLIHEFSDRFNIEVQLSIELGYPCLINDDYITSQALIFASEFLGTEMVKELEPRMASEDFAFYSRETPACFYRIGTGNPAKAIVSGVHTAGFNIDEDALEVSSGLMAFLAWRFLQIN